MAATCIASIEVFGFHPKLLLAAGPHRVVDMSGIELRDAFRVELADGSVGWGEARPDGGVPHADPHKWDFLVGRNAAALLQGNEPNAGGNANGNAGLFCALYDAVARHLGVPVWQLLGARKVRDWVPCAAWTRPAAPEDFAEEILRAVGQGYMAMKMHTSPHFCMFAQ